MESDVQDATQADNQIFFTFLLWNQKLGDNEE